MEICEGRDELISMSTTCSPVIITYVLPDPWSLWACVACIYYGQDEYR